MGEVGRYAMRIRTGWNARANCQDIGCEEILAFSMNPSTHGYSQLATHRAMRSATQLALRRTYILLLDRGVTRARIDPTRTNTSDGAFGGGS
jgi:hypothetical protein